MKDFIKKVELIIVSEFRPEKISLIDKSYLHAKHISFDSRKFHLKLIIQSEKLKKLNKIEAHKAIFSILKEEMKNKIHALEIKIE